jgi:predicted O-methyltransferase YrrM
MATLVGMFQEQWSEVDRYLCDRLAPADAVLNEALRASDAAGLPAINVTPNQGKLLHVLALAVAANRILEIGTLGGYSGIWLARALPPAGRLVTLEFNPRHAEVARGSFARAGVADRVDLRVGRAIDILPQLAADVAGPFDLVFIDADKASTAEYFDWAVQLARVGTLIVVDNVVRKGAVVNAGDADENVRGIRRFLDAASRDTRVVATGFQTVGGKGYDGMVVATVTQPGGTRRA